jgi:hypothetical protein
MPSLAQAVPSGEGDQVLVLTAGWHEWQSTPGSPAPATAHRPPIRQLPVWSAWVQVPPWQVSPVQVSPSSAHAVPSTTVVNADCEAAG